MAYMRFENEDFFPTVPPEAVLEPDETDFKIVNAALSAMRDVAKSHSTWRERREHPLPAVWPELGSIASSGMGVVYKLGVANQLLTKFGEFAMPNAHLPYEGLAAESHNPLSYAGKRRSIVTTTLVRPSLMYSED